MADGTSPLPLVERAQYDPQLVARTGSLMNKFVEPQSAYEHNGEEYVVVRLTAKGNEALRELCHTEEQKEVWRFPCYEFTVKSGRPSYVNAILIASRGVPQRVPCTHNTGVVFLDPVRLPGYWGGSCPGCKWRDHAARCSYASRHEAKYVPARLAGIPRGTIEELED
ncbi:hypothetical protein BBP40_011657 [Aspergillus hancockii]|nr:hypothetical protein BBP40_011657 [Aspergillus hancockii]